MAENVPKLMRQKVKMNPMRPTPRHIIIKLANFKYKEIMLKAARKKQLVTYKVAPIKPLTDFSTESTSQKGMARNIPNKEK